MTGYLARPKDGGPYPAVIVVHENRGLNPHIKDITRRVALEGFVALAPDFLSDLGGTPANEDDARNLFQNLPAEDVTANPDSPWRAGFTGRPRPRPTSLTSCQTWSRAGRSGPAPSRPRRCRRG